LKSLIKKSRLKEVQMILKKEECSPWSRDMQAKVFLLVVTYVVSLLVVIVEFNKLTLLCSWEVD